MVGLCRSLLCLGLFLGISTTGCQIGGLKKSSPPPLKGPELAIVSRAYPGSVLSGPAATPLTEESFKSTWMISATIWATESLPTDGFERLARQARLVLTTRGGNPVAPSARLSSELLIRDIPPEQDSESLLGEPTRREKMSELTTGVVPGMTVEIDIQPPSGVRPPLHPIRSGVEIRIARSNDSERYALGVVSQNLIPFFLSAHENPNNQDWVSPPPPKTPERVDLERETLVTDRAVQQTSDRWLLVVPMTFEDSPASAIVIELKIQTQPGEPERDTIVQHLQSTLMPNAVPDNSQPFSMLDADELRMRSALEGLSRVTDAPRGAMAYLAGLCGAELTEAIAIAADSTTIQLISQAVQSQSPGLSKVDRTNVAWLLERTTIETLNRLKNDASRPVSAGIDGVLAGYAGEVGRQIDALQSLVAQSTGPEDLRNRLIAENLIYLEDSSPSARVRAYDWLNRQGLAPEGYDPLGSPRERRRALERAAERRQALQPGNQP